MIRLALALALVVLSFSKISAHPHVWIDAKAVLVFDESDNFVAVRHVWEFDEGFSAFASQGLDDNGDGILTREELQELAEVNIDSLKEFEYFTFVQMGPDDPPYDRPVDYWLKHENGLLTLHFTVPMREPVVADPEKGFEELTVEVFDATFFVDVAFLSENPVKTVRLDGSQSACSVLLERRKELDIFQSQLLAEVGPSEDIPEDIAPSVGDLSNTMRVSCTSS